MGEAFLPEGPLALWGVGGVLAGLLVGGMALQREGAARAAWAMSAAGLLAAGWLVRDQPAGYRMLALCGALLYGMKAVVGAAAVRAGGAPLGPVRWLAFAALWPGMRPAPFHGLGSGPRHGAGELALRGLRNLACGVALVPLAGRLGRTGHELPAFLLGLPGISLATHFGLFNLAAGGLRRAGVDVGALFRNPPASRSLSEFWGRRWNRAFSEMTSIAVHRPLRARLGNRAAIPIAFLFSGALHELAISVPVRAGWGGPLGYFALHALAMALERRLTLEGTAARLWTLAWIVLPLPLLFHAAFRADVVAPLLGFP